MIGIEIEKENDPDLDIETGVKDQKIDQVGTEIDLEVEIEVNQEIAVDQEGKINQETSTEVEV